MFKPDLNALPAPQRAVWEELNATPKDFMLYGGTALALRLRQRQSEESDFFSNQGPMRVVGGPNEGGYQYILENKRDRNLISGESHYLHQKSWLSPETPSSL
jgi:hypothetical protein